jgi:GTP-binding protein EngB required for normal cell division
MSLKKIKKVNIEDMTDEQLDDTMTIVGTKMDKILVKAKKDVNKILEKYGLHVELSYNIKLNSGK